MRWPKPFALLVVLIAGSAFANPWPKGRYKPPIRDKGIFSDLDTRVRLQFPKWVAVGPLVLSRSGATISAAGVPVAFGAKQKLPARASTERSPGDADGDGIADVLDLLIGAKKTVLNAAVYRDAYRKLKYPGGDVPRGEGVCTDVVIRGLRNAGIDLQREVHRDIKRAPRAYRYVVKRRNASIDHRRVRTLLPYFRRHHRALSPDRTGAVDPLLPGDIIFLNTMKDQRPDHIGIISDRLGASGYPLVINNWTVGHRTAEMDLLGSVPITHRFRLSSASKGRDTGRGLTGLLQRRGLVIADRHHQLLLVIAPLWSSSGGQLLRFQRSSSAKWQAVGRPIRVRFGSKGLGRGRGLVASTTMTSIPAKREGDRRSPAGIFALGTAFGRSARRPFRGRWPYRAVDDRDRFVDDPGSPHYNTWQRLPRSGRPSWRSAERLSTYRLSVVVKHNTAPIVSGAGSAIFLHTTDNLDQPSIGCTTMKERHLKILLGWLRPSAEPVLVQVPGTLF